MVYSCEKIWLENHKEEMKIYRHNYYLNHKDAHKDYSEEYQKLHPEYHRLGIKKNKAKRDKSLGFEILWQPENINEPMDFHHINKTFVVAIPKKLHQSIPHSVLTGYNMELINESAINYIRGEIEQLATS